MAAVGSQSPQSSGLVNGPPAAGTSAAAQRCAALSPTTRHARLATHLTALRAGQIIPLRLLLRPRPGLAAAVGAEVAPLLMPLLHDPIAYDDAVTGLQRYSLISAPHDGMVSAHRLVQKITMAQLDLGVAEDWRWTAAALIEAALPDGADDSANWPVFAVLLPHAQAALTTASYGIDKVAAYLRAIGDHRRARDLQQRILTACELDLGAEHARTLGARASLATLTGEDGAPTAARDEFTALVPVFIRVLGAEHPRTLAARASLAYWTGETGAPATARDQFAALLPTLTRVRGAEHPATLAARENLARSTGDAGDAAGSFLSCWPRGNRGITFSLASSLHNHAVMLGTRFDVQASGLLLSGADIALTLSGGVSRRFWYTLAGCLRPNSLLTSLYSLPSHSVSSVIHSS